MGLEELPYLGFAVILATGCVSTRNGSSCLHLITHGVPQGSVIGSLLSLLYINDLPLTSTASHFVLFADKTSALIPVSPYADNNMLLNSECIKIFSWFYCKRLSVSCSKTKYMYFTLNPNSPTPKLLLITLSFNMLIILNCMIVLFRMTLGGMHIKIM